MDKDSSEIAKLTERIAKDPKSKLFVPLAEEYKKIGDRETAVRILTEGLKNNPSYVTARSFLGRLLMESGDLAGAQKELEEVVRAIPDNLLAQRKLGDLHTLRGNKEEALKRYRLALQLNPGDKEITTFVAELEAGRDISDRLPKSSVSVTVSKPAEGATAKPPAVARPVPAAAPGVKTSVPGGEVAKKPAVAVSAQRPSREVSPAPAGPVPPNQARTVPQQEQSKLAVSAAPADQSERKEMSSSVQKQPATQQQREAQTPVSAVPEIPELGVTEPDVMEEIVELEPLEQLAAEAAAAASAQSAVQPKEERKTEPVADIPSLLVEPSSGTFDLSEPVTEPLLFGGEQTPMEWKPPLEPLAETEQEAGSTAQGGAPGETQDDINTDTLAELYISQSFYDKAIEIYERMLSERPGTVALEEKLSKLRAMAASSGGDLADFAASAEIVAEEPPVSAPVPPEPRSPETMMASTAEVVPAEQQFEVPASPVAEAGQTPMDVKENETLAAAPEELSRPKTEDPLRAMQAALEGAEGQKTASAATAQASSRTAAGPGLRRKETIDRLENWLKNIIKEKPE